MQVSNKLVLVVGLLAVAVAAERTARAGNLDDNSMANLSSALFPVWNLELPMGKFATFTGGQATDALFIDDVTFAGDLDPCEMDDRCEILTRDLLVSPVDPEVLNPLVTYTTATNSNATVDTYSYAAAGIWGFSVRIRWSHARGTEFRGELACGTVGTTFHVFDRFAHTMYGQTIGRQDIISPAYPTPPGQGNGFWDYFASVEQIAEVKLAFGSVSGSICAVNTSESRHYSTPEVVLPGEIISFFQWTRPAGAVGPWGISSYRNAKALLRGRVAPQAATPTVLIQPFTVQ